MEDRWTKAIDKKIKEIKNKPFTANDDISAVEYCRAEYVITGAAGGLFCCEKHLILL